MRNREPNYQIDAGDGRFLFFFDRDIPRYDVPAGKLCFLVDLETGSMINHGAEENIDARLAKYRQVDPEGTLFQVEKVNVSKWPIEEINHCLVCSGYVGRAMEKLGLAHPDVIEI